MKATRTLMLAIAGLMVLAGRWDSRAATQRPNVLLVLSDDHSYPHVGCYGNADIQTPNLNRFAAQGLRFDRAYVACPQCVPSRAAIMTGRSPVRIAMTRFTAPLPMDVVTFPELLRQHGYFTGVAGRNFHLDGAEAPAESKAVLENHNLRTFARRLDYVKTTGRRPEMLAQLREFLDLVPKDKPFFLQLCFSDPHRPLDTNAIPAPHQPSKLKLPAHFPDTPAVREDFARYYDEIARFDGDFGRVLEELDKRGLGANTLVAFMGDNGASQLRGKGTLYELGIHVPLLVRWPGVVKPGSSSAGLISAEDLGPTFLEAAGAGPPKEMTGRSFLRVLRGEPFEGRQRVFAERGAHGSGLPTTTTAFDLARCVVTRTHKLIYNALWAMPYEPVDFANGPVWKGLKELNAAGRLPPKLAQVYFPEKRPLFELYDLEKDPAELDNLSGKSETAELEHTLKTALQEWMILERDYLPLPLPAGQARPAAARARQRAGSP